MHQPFRVRKFWPYPKPDTLEAHLISVAEHWATGNSFMTIDNLETFGDRLKRERDWYMRDNRRFRPVNSQITITKKHISITPLNRPWASAWIEINQQHLN